MAIKNYLRAFSLILLVSASLFGQVPAQQRALSLPSFVPDYSVSGRPFMSGLRIQVSTGTINISGIPTTYPAVTMTMAPNTTSYVYIDLNTGLETQNTTGFTATTYPIATVTTNASIILTLADSRPDVFGSGGGGGNIVLNCPGATGSLLFYDSSTQGADCDQKALSDGNGNLSVKSLAGTDTSQPAFFNLLSPSAVAPHFDFQMGTSPGNPATGRIRIYGDSVSAGGNDFDCILPDGTGCFYVGQGIFTTGVASSGLQIYPGSLNDHSGYAQHRSYDTGTPPKGAEVTTFLPGSTYATGSFTGCGASLPNGGIVIGTANGAGNLWNLCFDTSGTYTIPITTVPKTFSSLTASWPCNSTYQGTYAAITDSTTASQGATITGSGSNKVGAYCNGTNWVVVSGAATNFGPDSMQVLYQAAGGSANAQTATYSPAATLTNGEDVWFLPVAANTTTTPTFAPNGLTAKTITKCGTLALVAGDLNTAPAEVKYDGTEWILQNPQAVGCASVPSVSGGYLMSNIGSSAVGAVSANTTKVWATIASSTFTCNKVQYWVTTIDNSSNHYGLGLYDFITHTLVCDTGPVLGSSFAGASTGAHGVNLVTTGTVIAGRRYVVGFTGDAATLILGGQSNMLLPICNVNPATGSTTSGGQLNTSVTFSADAVVGCSSPAVTFY